MSSLLMETLSRELLLLALLFPYLLLLLLSLSRTRPLGVALAPWAALPALFAAALLPLGTTFRIHGLFSDTLLGIDEIGRLFLFFTSLLWWLGGWYARGWFMRDSAGQTRFAGFYLATMAGNLSLILAQDLLSFYLFFTFMNFAAYGLVVHRGTLLARHAGRIYITFLLLGEACLFTAVAVATTEAETLTWVGLHQSRREVLGLSLFLIGFGVKLGLLGLHVWLPPVYSAAPTPASALLSGAVIKASLLGWIRVLPLGTAGLEEWGQILVYLGLGASFYGSLVGILQIHPKTALAYSSISQMGLMTLLMGVGLHVPETAPTVIVGLLLFALHHALAKAALFLGIGVISTARAMPKSLVWAGLIWLALALAGAPGTSGALAKSHLSQSLAQAGLNEQLGITLSFASVATTLLMARFLYLLRSYQGEISPPLLPMLWLPWTMLLLTLLVMPWQWLSGQGREDIEALTFRQFWPALWPIALGILLAGLALYRLPPNMRRIPFWASRHRSSRRQQHWGRFSGLVRSEQLLHHWSVIGRLLVLLAMLLIITLW